MKKLKKKNEIRIIIAGSRGVPNTVDYQNACIEAMNGIFELRDADEEDVILVTGMARGADQLAYSIAEDTDMFIAEFPADWDNVGRSAGYVRNAEMAEYADHLIIVWNFESRGTRHMFDLAVRDKLYPIYIVPWMADERDIQYFKDYVVKFKPDDIIILDPIEEN